jgi:hypothetical protein
MPDSVRQHVKQNTKVPGVTIWVFSGLLLIGLVGIIALTSSMIQEAHYKEMARQEMLDEYNAKMEIVHQPQLGDVYSFTDKNSYHTTKFMLDSIAGSKIVLVKLEDDMRSSTFITMDTSAVKNYMTPSYSGNFDGASLQGISGGPFELEEVARGEYQAGLPTFDPNAKSDKENAQAAGDRDEKRRR